ncbi:MAG: AI-2E family transporter [Deltaproteobacteria bacterium]|nr:AI-2E family transporter [Deltaproteobacteria bacterium]
MPANRFYTAALIALVILLGYLSYLIFKPFLSPIAWAAVLSIVFYPVYLFVLRYVKWKSLASLATLIAILIMLLGPFSYFSYLISREAGELIDAVQAGRFHPLNAVLNNPSLRGIMERILGLVSVSEADLQKTILENVSRLGQNLVSGLTGGLGNVASAITSFVLMLLSTFFFLMGGSEFIDGIHRLIPFSAAQRERLFSQTKDIIVSTIYGGVVVAMAQAAIGGVAFSLLRVPTPGLCAFALFIASFIPLLGTFVVWGPLAAFLFLKGYILKGIILVIIGVLGISSVDNILRPLLIRGKTKLPTLAIFFSILGGIKLFGSIGFIMGPLVIALFISVTQILRYMGEEDRNQPDERPPT